MLRHRSPQNRNDRRGMKNRGRGLCKKAHDYHQLFGDDILVVLKAPNNGYEIGFQSKPGIFEAFCSASVPEHVLRSPKNFEAALLKKTRTELSALSSTDCSINGTTPSCSNFSVRESSSPGSPETPQPNEVASALTRPLADTLRSRTSHSGQRPVGKLPRGLKTKHSEAKLAALIEACFN